MRNLLLLLAVVVGILIQITTAQSTGKLIPSCKQKSTFYYTYNVRHETDCHKFYKCIGPYGFPIQCPTLRGVQLVFNEDEQICDWDGVPCSDDPEESTTTSTATASTPIGQTATPTSTASSSTASSTEPSATPTSSTSSSTASSTEPSATPTSSTSSSTASSTEPSATPTSSTSSSTASSTEPSATPTSSTSSSTASSTEPSATPASPASSTTSSSTKPPLTPTSSESSPTDQLLVIVVILATAIKVNNAEAECKLMPACRHKNTPVYTQHYPHESDPHKFYKCLGTYGCIMECPMYNNERLVYYQAEQWCDCEVRPCKEDSGDVTPTPSPTPIPGPCKEGKFYKHEDRHKFYECVNGKLVERQCLQGHCFNPIVSQCDLMSCD